MKEFNNIISNVVNNDVFMSLQNINHHGITRYNHSMRVAYYTYRITKTLKLNFEEATEAALLHDFFIDEVDCENKLFKLRRHPKYALENASKYFDLTELEKDIILTHMFPITFTPPKYLESWIVDIVDDVSAIYEKIYCIRKELNAACMFLFILLINYLK